MPSAPTLTLSIMRLRMCRVFFGKNVQPKSSGKQKGLSTSPAWTWPACRATRVIFSSRGTRVDQLPFQGSVSNWSLEWQGPLGKL